MNDWDKILDDFAHKCGDGGPDMTNPRHLALLRESLLKFGWKENATNEFIGNLREGKEIVTEDWWSDMSDKAQAAYIKKHGSAPNAAGDDAGGVIGKAKKKEKPKKEKKKKEPKITKKERIRQSKEESAEFMSDFSSPDKLNNKQRAEKIKESIDYINSGKTPEERLERFIEEKKKRREEIVNLDNLPAGTPASTLGEMFGGIAMEDMVANPNETEDEWVDRQMNKPPPDGIKGTPLYHKIIDKDNDGIAGLEKWLRTAHKTGKSELDIITNKSGKDGKYKGKNPQTPPWPQGNIMDYKGKALVQNQLEQRKEECKFLSGEEKKKCITHYDTQLEYLESLDETDTGVLYEMEDGNIGLKHTSNKSSIGDQLNNTSVSKKVEALNEALKGLDHVSDEEKQVISDGMGGAMKTAVTIVAQAESIVGRDFQTKEDSELEDISNSSSIMGVLTNLPFSGLSGPPSGREREYFDNATNTGHAKNELEELYGPEPKGGYTDQQKLYAIMQAAKKGGLEPLTKPDGKPTSTGKAAEEAGISSPPSKDDEGKVFSRTTTGGQVLYYKIVDGKARSVVKSTNPDTGEDEYTPDVAQKTGKVILKLSQRVKEIRDFKEKGMTPEEIANKFTPPMTVEEVNELLGPEYDFLEETYENRKNSMAKAHKIVVDEVKKQDEEWVKRNPEKAKKMGIPPANGPATQAYVDTWLDDTHIKRMLLDDETPTGMNMGGKAIEARHVRECLKKLTGKPDATPEELYEYLKKYVRVEAEGSSVVINERADETTGKGVQQLGKEDYRTKGDAKGIMAIFGKDMVTCLEGI
jgi:hypothetical protein